MPKQLLGTYEVWGRKWRNWAKLAESETFDGAKCVYDELRVNDEDHNYVDLRIIMICATTER